MSKIPKTAVIDTGFWIAIFNERDEFHLQALPKMDLLERVDLVLPWPTLYETVNTRLAKRPTALQRFEAFVQRPTTILLDDAPYRRRALDSVLSAARNPKRFLSLVDAVIRLMLDDTNVQVDSLVTFNPGDFADVCGARRIELL